MTTYSPNPTYVGPGRPPCEACGAAFRLHLEGPPARQVRDLVCPEAYRPGTLEEARRELAAAEASGDEARVFVARGNLQRLEGRPEPAAHAPAPQLMGAGQEWYCTACNRTVHRHGAGWRHNPERRP